MNKHLLLVALVTSIIFGATSVHLPAHAAGLNASAGPYRIAVTTDPSPIPVGRAKVVVHVTDAGRKEVSDARVRVLTKMPSMAMGERFEDAEPQRDRPGTYVAPANFQMAGKWDLTVDIEGPQGKGDAVLQVSTGMSTTGGEAGGFLRPFILVLLGLGLVVVVARVLSHPQSREGVRRNVNAGTVGGTLLLVAIYFLGQWVIARYRRPGAMTVLEAQAMDMTAMKPAVGAVPVAVFKVQRGSIDARVTYTGSVVPFVEEDIYPRVVGRIISMPVYPGDRVKNGQLLVRLDSTELESREGEARRGREAALHERSIADAETRQAVAGKSQAESELARYQGMARESAAALESMRRGEAQVRSELSAARQEKRTAEAERVDVMEGLTVAESELDNARVALDQNNTHMPQAEADLDSARADLTFQQAKVKRSAALLQTGAISQEEYQKDQAEARNAEAKVKLTTARVAEIRTHIRSAEAQVRQAQAKTRQARAKIVAAEARVLNTQARAEAAEARVGQSQFDVEAATARVEQARAGVRTAEAMLRSSGAGVDRASHHIAHSEALAQRAAAELTTASTVRGYTEIRTSVDGVVLQRLVSPGVLVSPGMAILKVAQIDPIRLQANVAEQDARKIRTGMSVRIRTSKDPARTSLLETRVASVFPAADPSSRTVVVEARMPNADARLKPGEYVVMEIATGRQENALLVPANAVVTVPQKSDDVLSLASVPVVWTVANGRRARQVRVQVGLTDGRFTEILSGLNAGDEVIYEGYEPLREGDPVVPARWWKEGPAELPAVKAGPPSVARYTCPMHPEVVQDRPGNCPKCGMKLVLKR